MSRKLQQRARKPRVDTDGPTLTKYYRSGNSSESASPFKRTPSKGKLRLRLLKSVDFIAIAAIFVLIGYSLMVSSKPVVVASDTSYHSMSDYQAAIAAELGLLKNRNKITIDETQIVLNIKKKFPEVTSLSLELPLFSQTPTARLTISPPSFVLNNMGRLYIVSTAGKAVLPASSLPAQNSLAVVNDQTGFNAAVGKQVLSSEGVEFLSELLVQSQQAGIKIQSIVLPPKAQELHLRTADKPGYYVKFYIGGDAKLQIGQFLATRHRFEVDNITPGEYLDVRVPGKIYYK
jgi:hypothetical protein